jgi:hypothetical protein
MTYLSEVNGPDSAEVLNFAPTRYELIQLVKHWATIVIDDSFVCFLYQQHSSSSERRRRAFAGRRINRIATVLGEEAVEKAINEAEEEYSKPVSPRAWSIFKNGTEEEWQAFQDEVQSALNQKDAERKGADDR